MGQHQSYSWLTEWIGKILSSMIVNCGLPDQGEMRSWIIRKAREMGGGFKPEAAQVLASYIGNDTLQANLEIEKLLTYVGEGGQVVEVRDVELLTTHEEEATSLLY